MTPVHAQFLGALTITAGLLLAMVWLAARMSLIELHPRQMPGLWPPPPTRHLRLLLARRRLLLQGLVDRDRSVAHRRLVALIAEMRQQRERVRRRGAVPEADDGEAPHRNVRVVVDESV